MKVVEAYTLYELQMNYDINAERGFLPFLDPLETLPLEFSPLEEIALAMPKLLAEKKLKDAIRGLAPIEEIPKSDRVKRLLMTRLSFLGHGWVWENWKKGPEILIPKVIAIPWYKVAESLGLHPILSYAPYALWNWKRIESRGPIELGNIVLMQNFLGGLDEEWFILVHIEIERKAGAAITSLYLAQEYARTDDTAKVIENLLSATDAMQEICKTLKRMTENCDPYIYYNRVRPYIHGWKNHPLMPGGIVYEGVEEFEGRPQEFRGETGAQSSIIPCLDAALGIAHHKDEFMDYLLDMRNYMPSKHRALVSAMERKPPLRNFVESNKNEHQLVAAFNQLINHVVKFRKTHLGYAVSYINRQAERSRSNPVQYGTGGTPFIPYLTAHIKDTKSTFVSKSRKKRK